MMQYWYINFFIWIKIIKYDQFPIAFILKNSMNLILWWACKSWNIGVFLSEYEILILVTTTYVKYYMRKQFIENNNHVCC